MKFIFVSLFPDALSQYMGKGIMGRASERGIVSLSFVDLREFALDKHSKVDDYPYGGKPGMLIKADVLYRAITSIDQYNDYRLLYACPKGPVFTQRQAESFANDKGLIFFCGYYEGVDERIFDLLSIERFSLGNFILSSGELPSLAVAEAVSRLVPGVLGNAECAVDDSIVNGLLEYPHYTAPRELENGLSVPEVLVSGHHGNIEAWRRRKSLEATLFQKPSLLWDASLEEKDQHVLVEILKEE